MLSNTSNLISEFLELLKLPAVCTWPALGTIPSEHPSYVGAVGRSGNSSAYKAMSKADFILVLGCRLSPKILQQRSNLESNCEIFSVDIDPGELNDGLIELDKSLCMDLTTLLKYMLGKARILRKQALNTSVWLSELKKVWREEISCKQPTKVGNIASFFIDLSRALGSKVCYCLDTGVNLTYACQFLQLGHESRVISSFGHSPMGFSLSAAIGAFYSKQYKQVVSIIGDGGIQMCATDLHTISSLELPILIIVINNRVLGNTYVPSIKAFSNQEFGNSIDTGYHGMDMKRLAVCFNIRFMEIDASVNHEKAIQNMLTSQKPLLVNYASSELYPFEAW